MPIPGNPAAVTIVEKFPTDSVCQNIASEMNLSETAFVKPLIKKIFISVGLHPRRSKIMRPCYISSFPYSLSTTNFEC